MPMLTAASALPTHRPIRQPTAASADVLGWHDEWTLHLDFMDADHRCLARQLGRIGAAVAAMRSVPAPADRHALISEVRSLGTLARRHFAREEEVMRVAAYPHWASHRNEHQVLLGECEALLADARAGRVDWSDPGLLPALEHWLVGHVLDDDRLLARYLRRSGMALVAPTEPLTLD